MILYRETPCEHNQMRSHLYGEMTLKEFAVGENMLHCSGGSREKVTIDYEAGANAIPDRGQTIAEFRIDAKAAIDAALGRTKAELTR